MHWPEAYVSLVAYNVGCSPLLVLVACVPHVLLLLPTRTCSFYAVENRPRQYEYFNAWYYITTPCEARLPVQAARCSWDNAAGMGVLGSIDGCVLVNGCAVVQMYFKYSSR